MKILIALHSTTGNTRLVTRFATERLRAAGHDCEVVNIVRHPDPPARLADEVDLLGLACPTMYFRATVAMERYAARLPNAPVEGRPAFLLGTAAGETGAHFPLLAEQLAHKGWMTLGAHFVISPSNYPIHLHAVRWLSWSKPLGDALARHVPLLRSLWGFPWPSAAEPNERDRDALGGFLDETVRQAASGRLDEVPPPSRLARGLPTCAEQGRMIAPERFDAMARIRIDAPRCSACGTCVALCPAGVLTRERDDAVPDKGRGCIGCFACFNNCPEGAIAGIGAPPGKGRYPGPSLRMRRLFGRS